jgi:hypothetical protein
VTALESAIEKIERGDKGLPPGSITGLESASTGLSAALRVVEGGDRTAPSQAVDLYHEFDQVAKNGIAQWTHLKSGDLAKLNESLKAAGLDAIQVSAIEQAVEYLTSQ